MPEVLAVLYEGHVVAENAPMRTTSLPIVLQMTTQQTATPDVIHITSIEKLPPSGINENNNEVYSGNYQSSDINEQHLTSNNVEVFDDKQGPTNQKQEEEEQAETEAGGEEPPNEESPPEPEIDTAEPEEEAAVAEAASEAEPEPDVPEPASETEPEPEEIPEPEAEAEPEIVEQADTDAQPEAEVDPEPAQEPEPEPEPAPEPEPTAVPEPEPAPEPETPASDAAPIDDGDNEMQNDAPADTPSESVTSAPALHTNNEPKTCYSCNSHDDTSCKTKPGQKMNCKTGDPEKNAGHTGCYTIFKVDSNMTMRGCVDELAEEGLRDCLTKEKFCTLCYSNNCNNQPANGAISLEINVTMMIIINGFVYCLIKYL
ncbi:uncharacterized protein LOC142226103 isoform X2 [Haematobia irritans]|uniref:uncharacterized protein LOC142226103 isoform X2 n=1 Tax=Haematobia irritans TaxID=7368 RepID=UPI003F4F9668